MDEAGMNALHMPLPGVISALNGVRRCLEDERDAGQWNDPEGLDALEAAAVILRCLDEEEGAADAEGVKDLLYDYHGQCRELRLMRDQNDRQQELIGKLRRDLDRERGILPAGRGRDNRNNSTPAGRGKPSGRR